MICKLSLHIFGNLIAHCLLASQGSFTPDARVSLGVFFVLEWVLNGRVWLLAKGIPTDEINPWNGQEEDSFIYPHKTLFNTSSTATILCNICNILQQKGSVLYKLLCVQSPILFCYTVCGFKLLFFTHTLQGDFTCIGVIIYINCGMYLPIHTLTSMAF